MHIRTGERVRRPRRRGGGFYDPTAGGSRKGTEGGPRARTARDDTAKRRDEWNSSATRNRRKCFRVQVSLVARRKTARGPRRSESCSSIVISLNPTRAFTPQTWYTRTDTDMSYGSVRSFRFYVTDPRRIGSQVSRKSKIWLSVKIIVGRILIV